MRKISIVLVLLMLLCGCMLGPLRYETVPEIRAPYRASVSVIVHPDMRRARAAGTIIYSEDNDRFVVLTAAHVVKDREKHYVEHYGKVMEMEVLKVDHRRDLALIVSIKKYKKLPSIKLTKHRPHIGETVWVIGSPRGDKKSVSRGVFSKIKRDIIRDRFIYKVDAAAFYGSSGGGVFNDQQELVGIVVGGQMTHPAVAIPGGTLAVGIETIKHFLKGELPK